MSDWGFFYVWSCPYFQAPPEYNYYIDYINQPSIRKLMKVGAMPYGAQSDAVEKAIVLDIMDTVRDWLAVLMDNYKVSNSKLSFLAKE